MNYAEEATNKEHVGETIDYTLIIHDPAVRKVKHKRTDRQIL